MRSALSTAGAVASALSAVASTTLYSLFSTITVSGALTSAFSTTGAASTVLSAEEIAPDSVFSATGAVSVLASTFSVDFVSIADTAATVVSEAAGTSAFLPEITTVPLASSLILSRRLRFCAFSATGADLAAEVDSTLDADSAALALAVSVPTESVDLTEPTTGASSFLPSSR